MIRSVVTLAVVVLVGLFGFYFLTDRSERDNVEKAKDAGRNVVDTVRDQGAASLVSVRMTSTFGMEATRFLHVYYNDRHAVIYGMAPDTLTPEAIVTLATNVTGVDSAEAHIQPLPTSLQTAERELKPADTSAAPAEPD